MDILLDYDEQLAPLVETGQKLQTIRSREKTFAEPGDTLSHFCGRRFLGASPCTSVMTIDIIQTSRVSAVFIQAGAGQRRMGNMEISALAIKDGFPDTDAFYAWFAIRSTHYQGKLIQWQGIFPF